MENNENEVTVEVIEVKETVKQKIKNFYVKHKTKIAVGATALTTAAITALVCSIGNAEDENEEVYYESIEAPIEVIDVTPVETESEEV